MHRSKRSTILLAVVAAVIAAVAVAGIATAASPDATSAKKKPLFTKKQKKEINKLIDQAIAKIPPVTIPASPVGPAAYAATNAAQIDLPSNLATDTDILSKSLPAGKYVVSGHVNGFYLTDAVADEANLVCRAKVNGTTVQSSNASNDAGIFLLLATAGTLNIPFNFTVDAAAASTLSVDCSAGYDSPGAYTGVYVGAGAAKFNAVTVASVG
ncbi:MAG: hypothetical protein JHD02_11355 [Thermoleophilaceae bacterium]|nr:hypothetical protein [Thermoleophilaceae bacterium]